MGNAYFAESVMAQGYPAHVTNATPIQVSLISTGKGKKIFWV